MSATRTVSLLALVAALVTPTVFAAEKADAVKGKDVFITSCALCHSDKKEAGGPIMGPNLVGVFGRKAGTVKDFAMYTPALKAYGVKWDAKSLDEFVKDPFGKVPGTQMIPMGLDDQARADVVAYLATLK